MKTYFNVSEGSLIRTWVSVIVIFVVLSLSNAIFGPVMLKIFAPLVEQYAYNKPALLSASHLVILFFNSFFYFMALFVLIWAVLSSLKREADYGYK
jgi:hypothetical protein